MRYNKKIIETVNNKYQKKRGDGFNELSLRKEKLYKQIPRLLKIERELSLNSMELIKLITEGKELNQALENQKQKNLNLQKERAEILFKNKYPIDYLSNKYDCLVCKDTGYIGAKMCECFKAELKKEAHKDFNLATLMPDATFENFKLNYYSDKLDGDNNRTYTPRQNAKLLLKVCKDFCMNFDKINFNILFCGKTGLGKTYLSSAIAWVLIDSGYDVVYETAANIFALLEDLKFNRISDQDKDRADRLFECDLLIIDDLGTELITQFVVSALFNIINTRILYNKKIVISTNYTIDEIETAYGARILSRILGDFKILNLYGKDIRVIKKGL